MTKTNKAQYEILKHGTEAWNLWREANPTIWPDLMDAELPYTKLDSVNLENANLLRANLEGASLIGARLRNANLKEANLKRTDLTRADLEEANLYGAQLQEANMIRTNLIRANLVKAGFDRNRLDFATFGETSFDHNLVLGGIGLDLIFHTKTAILDVQVFERAAQAARGNREKKQSIKWFFQNAGVTERIVRAALEALSQPPSWSSCFISYSHDDKEFVELLCSALSHLGVPCSKDDDRFEVGVRVSERAAGEIIRNDRTLLCCSRRSLWSNWVIEEAEVALEREEKQGRSVLVPLDLDGCLLENPYRPGGPSLVQKLRGRVIGDFQKWREPVAFKDSLNRLLETLRADSGLTD